MANRKLMKQKASVGSSMVATEFSAERPATFSGAKDHLNIQISKVRNFNVSRNVYRWFIINIILISIGFILAATGVFTYKFAKAAKLGWSEITVLVKEIYSGFNHESSVSNLILLGTDAAPGFREKSTLTDVMMLIKIPNEGTVKSVSIPRDLWLESLQTRVNSLYYYGLQRGDNGGTELVNSAILEMFNIVPDRNITVSMESFKELVTLLGGVEVDVRKDLVDNQFPREIDVNSKDPTVLYETISFKAGKQIMDGDTALKYVRSRHSANLDQGTDNARSLRQQEVVEAIIKKISNLEIVYHPSKLGLIWNWYKTQVKTDMTLGDMMFFAKKMTASGSFKFESHPLVIGSPNDSDALIFHPANGPMRQWVYLPIDPSFTKIKDWYEKL